MDEIKLVLRKELDVHRLCQENQSLREALGERYEFRNIVAKSSKMQEVLNIVNRVAAGVAVSILPRETFHHGDGYTSATTPRSLGTSIATPGVNLAIEFLPQIPKPSQAGMSCLCHGPWASKMEG
jgi:two-component system, NtrC family, response regulator